MLNVYKFTKAVERGATVALSTKDKKAIYEEYNTAYECYSSCLEDLNVPSLSKSRKEIKVVYNLLGGILNGLDTEDISLRDLRCVSRNLLETILPKVHSTLEGRVEKKIELPVMLPVTKVVKKVVVSKFTEIENQLEEALNFSTKTEPVKVVRDKSKPAKVSVSQQAPSFKITLEEISRKLKEQEDIKNKVEKDKEGKVLDLGELSYESLKTRIQFLKEQQSKLPLSCGKSGFSIFKLPILPVFNAIDRNSGIRAQGLGTKIQAQPSIYYLLKHLGIQSFSIDEYLVVDNQVLLAIDKNAIPNKEVKVKSKKTSKVVIKEVQNSPLDYANHIIDILNETGSNKYSLVSEMSINNPRNTNIVLFWLMSSPTLSVLIRKGLPKLHTWGLPF